MVYAHTSIAILMKFRNYQIISRQPYSVSRNVSRGTLQLIVNTCVQM